MIQPLLHRLPSHSRHQPPPCARQRTGPTGRTGSLPLSSPTPARPPRASLGPCPLCTPPAPRQALHSWPGLAAFSLPCAWAPTFLSVQGLASDLQRGNRLAVADDSISRAGGFSFCGAFLRHHPLLMHLGAHNGVLEVGL